jgi:hypothetical protein
VAVQVIRVGLAVVAGPVAQEALGILKERKVPAETAA